MECFQTGGVTVEKPIGRFGDTPIVRDVKGRLRVLSPQSDRVSNPGHRIWRELQGVPWREDTVIIIRIHFYCQPDLAEVAQALYDLSLFLGPTQRRQQQACQDRNDRNDDQQFDKSKCRLWTARVRPRAPMIAGSARVGFSSHIRFAGLKSSL